MTPSDPSEIGPDGQVGDRLVVRAEDAMPQW